MSLLPLAPRSDLAAFTPPPPLTLQRPQALGAEALRPPPVCPASSHPSGGSSCGQPACAAGLCAPGASWLRERAASKRGAWCDSCRLPVPGERTARSRCSRLRPCHCPLSPRDSRCSAHHPPRCHGPAGPWAPCPAPSAGGGRFPRPLRAVLGGEAGLPRGARSTGVFSSCEKQSRPVRSGSCLPGEKHSTQLAPPAAPGGRHWRSPEVLQSRGAPGLPARGAAPPLCSGAGHQGPGTRGPQHKPSLSCPGCQPTPRPSPPGAPRGFLRQGLLPPRKSLWLPVPPHSGRAALEVLPRQGQPAPLGKSLSRGVAFGPTGRPHCW